MENTALIIDPNCTVIRTKVETGTPALFADQSKMLRSIIGNLMDCVRGEDFVGYVDDEGLMHGLEYNAIASALFGRYLVGRVVVLGSISPTGEYDGACYDCPESVYGIVSSFIGAMHLHEDFDGKTPMALYADYMLTKI